MGSVQCRTRKEKRRGAPSLQQDVAQPQHGNYHLRQPRVREEGTDLAMRDSSCKGNPISSGMTAVRRSLLLHRCFRSTLLPMVSIPVPGEWNLTVNIPHQKLVCHPGRPHVSFDNSAMLIVSQGLNKSAPSPGSAPAKPFNWEKAEDERCPCPGGARSWCGQHHPGAQPLGFLSISVRGN